MNGDPYRTSQQPDRRVINRSGAGTGPSAQSARQGEEPQVPLRDEPRVASSRTAPQKPAGKGERASKWPMKLLVIVLLVLAVCAVGWVVFSKIENSNTGINTSQYQAVSFADGQLYFGKLSRVNDEYMKLTDVYYLQPQAAGQEGSESVQNAATNQNNFKLIKFTDVVYGPEDTMMIPKNQILFYENIAPNGKVAQLIKQSQSNK